MAYKSCSVGCNYLSMSEIPASGTQVFLLVAMCTWWHGWHGFQELFCRMQLLIPAWDTCFWHPSLPISCYVYMVAWLTYMASKGYSVGCNYLSLPEIPASGTQVFLLVAMCTWWQGFDGLPRCPGIISTVSSLQECGWQWQWKTKPGHNAPGHGRNQPDADSIGLILAMFWHTMVCLWVRQQGCYQKLQVNDYRAVARGLFH